MDSHPILTGRKDWKSLQRSRANLDRAEQQYRASAELSADLEAHGWDPAREAAAWRGEAVMGNPAATYGPILDLNALAGRQVTPAVRLTHWSWFVSARARVAEEEQVIKRGSFREIREQAQRREGELLQVALRTAPDDLGAVVEELRGLVAMHYEAAGLAQMRDAEWLPRPDRVGLVEVLQAAVEGRSLLDPVVPDQRDARLLVRRSEGGAAAAVRVRNRYQRDDEGPIQRTGPEPERVAPIRRVGRRTEVDYHRMENPPEGQPRVPPPRRPAEATKGDIA